MINQELVMEAFRIFSKLNAYGEVLRDEGNKFFSDETVRGLIMEFAEEVDCTIITAGDYIYLVPLTKNSIYHMTNSDIKRKYFPNKAVNMDIYLMYVAIIIFIGEFYDSYQSTNPTRDFISVNDWLQSMNTRMEALNQIDKESLESLEQDYEYNWIGILKKWEAMDNIKEGVRKQTAKTASRMGFMNIVKNFMIDQKLINEIGLNELELTEKTKGIVGRYFMEYEHNRGILEVIYELENQEG
ncbi:MAG: DUF6063 family protein [Vallitalea sp.]|jgi:hypothetical protein|nr:DUF6063 family protein [Vallitalea sp.]